LNKVAASRGIFGIYLTIRYFREMQDNVSEGDWREAVSDTAWYGIAVSPVVAPNFVFGNLSNVAIGTAVGVGATYFVLDQLGWESESFTELVFDTDVRDIPKKYVEVVGPAVLEKINEVFKESENQLQEEWNYLKDKAAQGANYGKSKLDEVLDWSLRGLPSIEYSI
jgi:hypothetical protein